VDKFFLQMFVHKLCCEKFMRIFLFLTDSRWTDKRDEWEGGGQTHVRWRLFDQPLVGLRTGARKIVMPVAKD
jgi:hypothetical protein